MKMRKNKKKNIYINYERSYRNKSRKRSNTLFGIIVVALLAIGLGLGTTYVVGFQMGYGNRLKKDDDSQDGKLSSDDIANPDDIANLDEIAEAPTPPITSDNEMVNDETILDNNNDEVVEEIDNRLPVEVKGIYVTSKAIRNKSEELIKIADTTEINAIVIDVKDDNGRITFEMDSPLAKEIGALTDSILDMEDFIRQLKEKDIYPIARIVAFKDPNLAEQKHELAIKNKDGSLYRDNGGECWINPYEKEVWDYLIEVSTKAAEIGFMEIQFDYIRFSTGKGMSEVDFGPLSAEKSKEDIIIEFTKYAYESLKPLGVFVSADVYGTIISSSIDAGLVGQNYVEMSKYLDYICPMIYPSHFGKGNYGVEYPDLEPLVIVRKVLHASKTNLEQIPPGEHKAIVRPWLQDFTATWITPHQEYGGDQLREQIDGVYAAGYKEWLLWDASCNYSVDGLEKK